MKIDEAQNLSMSQKINELRKEILQNLPKLICHDGVCCTTNANSGGIRCQVNKMLLEYFVQSELVRMTNPNLDEIPQIQKS